MSGKDSTPTGHWTADAPEVDGWYWFRYRQGECPAPIYVYTDEGTLPHIFLGRALHVRRGNIAQRARHGFELWSERVEVPE